MTSAAVDDCSPEGTVTGGIGRVGGLYVFESCRKDERDGHFKLIVIIDGDTYSYVLEGIGSGVSSLTEKEEDDAGSTCIYLFLPYERGLEQSRAVADGD